MTRLKYLIFALILLLVQGCAHRSVELMNIPAPSVLPNTEREMKTPGFWLSKHPSPDGVVMNAAEIEEFNKKIISVQGTVSDLADRIEKYSGKTLKKAVKGIFDGVANRRLYLANGVPPGEDFFRSVETNMDLASVPDTGEVKYGFISYFADQRLLPTDALLSERRGDVDFDELENNTFDVGAPLIVLHESRDGAWYFTESETSSGWVKKECVALCGDRAEFLDNLKGRTLVITSPKADIYLDPDLKRQYDYARMGSVFRYIAQAGTYAYEVIIPGRDSAGAFYPRHAYINMYDASQGYLQYTPRTILTQAFKLLNEPYGWGGMNGEQDCSAFVQAIYKTVGVGLPRNSSAQAKAGRVIWEMENGMSQSDKEIEIQSKAGPGSSILYMKGHVLIYIGSHKGKAYAIHETWAYSKKDKAGNDIRRIIGKAVVSDLSLGEGSEKGSLLARIQKITAIDFSAERLFREQT